MPLFRGRYEVSRELLDDFRSRFLEEIDSEPEEATKYHPDDLEQVKCSDSYIYRYLMHQDNNVDNALKMMKKSLEFRNEMEVNTLKKEDFPQEFFDSRVLQAYNHDKHNYPLLVMRTKAHEKRADKTRLEQQCFLYWVEKTIKANDWGGITFMLDCTDAGYKNVDIDFMKFFSNTFQQYYPWTCHKFLVYNMPWYMTAIWTLVKTWIPDKYINRVAFLNQESILEHVEKDQLPVCLGGTCTDPYEPEEVQKPS